MPFTSGAFSAVATVLGGLAGTHQQLALEIINQ